MNIQRSKDGKIWHQTSIDWLERTLNYHYNNNVINIEDVKEANKIIKESNSKIKNKDKHISLISIPISINTFDEFLIKLKKSKTKELHLFGNSGMKVKYIGDDKEIPVKVAKKKTKTRVSKTKTIKKISK